MKNIRIQMNLKDHCPECGALLMGTSDGSLCPCCGFVCDNPEDTAGIPPWYGLPGHYGEGMRLLLMDEMA